MSSIADRVVTNADWSSVVDTLVVVVVVVDSVDFRNNSVALENFASLVASGALEIDGGENDDYLCCYNCCSA